MPSESPTAGPASSEATPLLVPTTTSSPSATPIPWLYRTFFTYLDPVISTSTAVLALLSPATLLPALIPPAFLPYDPQVGLLVSQLGALFGTIAILCAVLLRYTADLGVWKILQTAILFADVAILGILAKMLVLQGRASPAEWTGNDWGNLIVTAVCAVVRGAFVAGIGLRGRTGRKGSE